ncbi:hypothetical protein [Asticcacaulis sp. 201]|uniref:hypothetical protein n=1 Tax=Asticcacaulis sp. 201 TaxID=3028787 RepID=UPI0029164EC8|nr:hypothetical protein [Asticcacaulis sp. 201]MDV6330534.1 hypothetical protein [Asticcacaulis sp. 201]
MTSTTRRATTILVALLSLTACKPAKTVTEPTALVADASSPAAQTPDAKAPAAKTFVINELNDDDGDIMGCTTMLTRASGGRDIFREDGVDSGAKGFLRIDGKLMRVDLTGISRDNDSTGTRLFSDATGRLTVKEAYVIGAAHQESDSVEMTGNLTVTWDGVTQSVAFAGGTAC